MRTFVLSFFPLFCSLSFAQSPQELFLDSQKKHSEWSQQEELEEKKKLQLEMEKLAWETLDAILKEAQWDERDVLSEKKTDTKGERLHIFISYLKTSCEIFVRPSTLVGRPTSIANCYNQETGKLVLTAAIIPHRKLKWVRIY